MLIATRHRNTAIVVKQTPSGVRVVAMQPGELIVTKLLEEDLTAEWGEMVGYPLEQAIVKYLNHPGGVSPAAKSALEDLLMDQL